MAAYLLIGFRIYPDYGVSIDEYSQMELGRVNYERIVNGSPEIQTQYDRYYGPAFEVPLYVFSGFAASRMGIPEMSARHMGTFVFFVFSLVFFYRFLSKLNGHPAYGMLGVLLLVLFPRFFAESFYNTKDLPFVSATMLLLWALGRKPKPVWSFVVPLALTTGFAVAVRAQGLLLAFVVGMSVLVSGSGRLYYRVRIMLSYAALAMLSTFAMFPVFWNDTLKNVTGFWAASANPVGVPTYYFGRFYVSPGIPWHYHFVWVAITGWLSVSAACIVGLVWFVRQGMRRVTVQENLPYVAMAFIILGTFLTSVLFHPRSYDGWRHIYYIYPCMAAFAVVAVRYCAERFRQHGFRIAMLVMIAWFAADALISVRFMIRNHPNQYLYFNALAGGYFKAKANFDFDYWGISQKQILDFFLTRPVPAGSSIYIDQILPYAERVMIPALHARGMIFAESVDQAEYYVTIYRDFRETPPAQFRKVFAVTVEGVDVSAVWMRE